ncbi:MAG TPA: divergent polysaccharide deacetylase family protein, partial [Thermoanaerobaculia bacterium]|nr:divergent polysaccharide deacetylase family protein [Thermoanaerobaculia bacterium]
YPQVRPGPGVVLRSQTIEQITQTLQSDLESVPGAVGVSNHMGSAATADSRVMQAVARVLARRGLFFVDSRTTDTTVAQEVVRRERVPAVSRRVFLDDRATPEAIAQSLAELLTRARAGGSALALGHPYPATLDVLERELPGLASRGVRLVKVSELVQ